ncbi:leucine-rich repeat domain-containing protein [Sutcliffiella rhizosphaerae]|uniref:Leucine-rich repeat domain-containing protein n=1 Tax=Sutcliffiella rhizosphaerae TaxID=2880967 RepID=A0ABM8YUX3_9BACI|nr:hypothetical protein [Sutcliffiella rhizosphaerae]CAG9623737.1 hypothetical protein BACCIP111883_04569 [Sutcliffiella rhizosphaerae]
MYSKISEGRIQIKGKLTEEEVHELLHTSELEVIQFQSEVELDTFQLLNDILFSVRDDIVLRVYGFSHSSCDFCFLEKLPNLSRFCAECYEMVENIGALSYLKKLKELELSIFNLESFDIFTKIPNTLEELVLGETKSKKPNLAVLERFEKLQKLFIVGHKKNIDVISKLENLEELALTSVTTENLDFLLPLKKLCSLTINLGGIHNFSAIEGLGNISYLELFQIRGLSDLSFISTITGLQYLSLQNLPNVNVLPDLSNLSKLKKVALESMKGLKDLSSLENAAALVEFTHWSAMNMNIDDYVPLLQHPSLERVSVGFGSDKKNRQFEKLAEEYGKTGDIIWHNKKFFYR